LFLFAALTLAFATALLTLAINLIYLGLFCAGALAARFATAGAIGNVAHIFLGY